MTLMRPCSVGLLLLSTSSSCGARSGLYEVRSEERDAGAMPDASAVHDAAVDSPPDVIDDVAEEAPTDGATGPCIMKSAGPPVEVLATAAGAVTPSLVVAEAASASAPARLAVPAVAPGMGEIHVALPAVGSVWPADVESDHMLMLGNDSFSYPQIARAVSGAEQLVVTWLGGPGALRVRWAPITLPGLQVSPAYPVDVEGGTPVDLAAGRVFLPDAGGEASGFAIATQVGGGGNPPQTQQPVISLLDEAGTLIAAAPLTAPVPNPAPDPSLLWTGTTFVAASAHRNCAEADPFCAPNAITVSRLEDDPDVGPVFTLPTVIEPLDGYVPRRPALASDGQVYVAWFEGVAGDPEAPEVARIKWLDDLGVESLDLEAVITEEARPLEAHIGLTPTSFGLVVSWAEDGDPEVADGALGRSRLVLYRVVPQMGPGQEPWLEVADGPVTIEMTKYRSRAAPPGAALPAFDAAVFAWSGWSAEFGSDSVHLGRVDCVP